ncbi:hypothetical protein FJTKL_03298 [Diaporthe vaccinii]|uniref:Uncharacterized protein n=1 Tax=Diaporthe vaccinii TaxID=105482 RepID=A0ABR4DX43_9PEZI
MLLAVVQKGHVQEVAPGIFETLEDVIQLLGFGAPWTQVGIHCWSRSIAKEPDRVSAHVVLIQHQSAGGNVQSGVTVVLCQCVTITADNFSVAAEGSLQG